MLRQRLAFVHAEFQAAAQRAETAETLAREKQQRVDEAHERLFELTGELDRMRDQIAMLARERDIAQSALTEFFAHRVALGWTMEAIAERFDFDVATLARLLDQRSER